MESLGWKTIEDEVEDVLDEVEDEINIDIEDDVIAISPDISVWWSWKAEAEEDLSRLIWFSMPA